MNVSCLYYIHNVIMNVNILPIFLQIPSIGYVEIMMLEGF